jgi:uncharacterized lipoprotein YmbA
MFDISCLYGKPEFATIQTDAFNIWKNDSEINPLNAEMAQQMKAQFNLTVDGQHYFAQKDGKGPVEAIWDLRSSGPFKGNKKAIVFAHKVKTAPSPDGSDNIDWVELAKDSGGLAKTVYRINTVKGQPSGSVSSSVNWRLPCSIDLIFHTVLPQQFNKCQVCHKILYVYTI